jgi:hypothetical protein
MKMDNTSAANIDALETAMAKLMESEKEHIDTWVRLLKRPKAPLPERQRAKTDPILELSR